MCLLVLAWKCHPRYRLVMAANRDEFHDRPAAPLGVWPGEPSIVAGRDLRGGGTWMGATRPGHFGVVTNFRDLEAPPAPDAPSRGELVPRFLTGGQSAATYLDELRQAATRYAGFNLLVGGPGGLHYFSNRNGAAATELAPGVYGLSNHLLDSPWPKLLRTRHRLAALLERDELAPGRLFEILADRTPADADESPDTGLPADWERVLSAPFVVHDRYGTRCSTVLLVDHAGRSAMFERRFDAKGTLTGATRLEFGPGAAATSAVGPGTPHPHADAAVDSVLASVPG
jgi:uncharacterized protein with NRDE domain